MLNTFIKHNQILQGTEVITL